MSGRRQRLRDRVANPQAAQVDRASTPMQLRVDGGEDPHVRVVKDAPLGPRQYAVLHEMRHVTNGVINPSRAGRVCHAVRDERRRAKGNHGGCWSPTKSADAKGCCKWAASDGYDVLLSLMARGLVTRIQAGVYVLRKDVNA